MTNPDQQRRLLGGDAALPANGGGGTDSCVKTRTALTVYQAQERQLAIQKKEGTLVDRSRGDAHVQAQLEALADLRVSLGWAQYWERP
jgi:hypothetical protein